MKRISWDEALDRVAEEYRKALDEDGPESVSMYGSGQWTVFDGYAATKWMRAGLGSNNLEPNARPLHGERRDGLRDAVPER